MNELFIVSLLSKGGFFVYPILLCSVVALAIFLKKIFLIQEKKVLPEFFLNKLQSYIYLPAKSQMQLLYVNQINLHLQKLP